MSRLRAGMAVGGRARPGDGAGMLLIAAVLAAGGGALTVWQPAMAGAVAVALVLGVALERVCSGPGRAPLVDKRFLWVSLAWAFVLLHPIGRFTAGRSALAATEGSVSFESLLELVGHLVIAVAAVASIRRNRLGGVVPWPVVAFAGLALASTVWSLTPTVTFAFALELFAFVPLAILTASIVRADAAVGRQVVRRTLRVMVLLVAGLAAVGLAVGDAGTLGAIQAEGRERFTWPGTHPISASAQLGFAFLVVLYGGREGTGFSVVPRVGLLVLFAVCLYLGQTRTVLIAVVVSVIVGYLLTTRGRSVVRRLVGYLGASTTALLAATLYGAAVFQYLLRDERQEQVFGLNGRLGLWELALAEVESPERWLAGYGIGGPRVFLSSLASWAGGAHSAWLELLLALGLLGLAAGLALVLTVALRLVAHVRGDGAHGTVLAASFVYVLSMSPTVGVWGAPGPGPGLGFGLLAFSYAVCAVRQRATATATAPAAGPARGRLVPERVPSAWGPRATTGP